MTISPVASGWARIFSSPCPEKKLKSMSVLAILHQFLWTSESTDSCIVQSSMPFIRDCTSFGKSHFTQYLGKPWSHEYGKATKKGLGKWEKRALVFKAQNWFHAVPWVLMTCAVWRISWGAKNQVKNGRECRLHCLAACCQPQLHTIHSLHGTQKRENVEGFSQELLMG